MAINFKETQYGFEYGALAVERAISTDAGYVVISVVPIVKGEKDYKRGLWIECTPKGRKVKIRRATD